MNPRTFKNSIFFQSIFEEYSPYIAGKNWEWPAYASVKRSTMEHLIIHEDESEKERRKLITE
jgi:hypothetical protein